MTRRRNSWGSVRQLASGRFQARYRVAGVEHLAPCTFRTKRDADAYLATVVGPPKTAAGVRRVAIPQALIPELEAHVARWAAPGPDGLVFCGTRDQPMRRASLYTAWRRAVRVADVDGLRFHDLRHTGNTLAAATGASTRDLMTRMGHASPRAR
jgi:integrase